MIGVLSIISDEEEYSTADLESVISDDVSFHSVLDSLTPFSESPTNDFRSVASRTEEFRSVTPDPPNEQFHDTLPTEVVVSRPPSSAQTSTSAAGDDDFVEGETVMIVGGVHEGKQATFEKRTPKRIGVRLNESPDKVTYLAPSNVRGPTHATTEDSVSPPRHDPFIHRETTTRRGSERRNNTVSTSADVTSPFAVAGGEDELLHSFLGLREECCTLLFPNENSHIDRTFAAKIFGSRLRSVEVNMTSVSEELPKNFATPNGRRYELVCSKVHSHKGGHGYGPSMKGTAHYVVTEGPAVPQIDLQEVLEEQAGFGRLPPEKGAARLELLFSPARAATFNKAKRPYLIFDDLTSEDFEEIPELATEGCGFIPRKFIHHFLGNHRVGMRTFGIQIRIFAPSLGIFKGVLMEKPGIDKIQLPASMQKVGPSEIRSDNKACLVITAIAPSDTNLQVAKIVEGGNARASFSPSRLSKMAVSLLTSLDVPVSLLQQYVEASYGNRGRGLQHTSLFGVADPTNAIPSGHIFLMGIQNTQDIQDEIFVTRFPCTESSDGHVLTVIRSKPDGMSEASWSFLQTLDFGGIIFGNPGPGERPLPTMIANGDLDGDLYLVCWNEQILSSIQREEPFVVLDDEPMATSFSDRPWNTNWLSECQDLMRDIPRMASLSRFIGKLYKLWKDGVEKDDPGAVLFGRAFKKALDIGKHGGQVKLPSQLWSKIPKNLQCFLCDS